jgi:hypothetical protein
MGPVPTRRHRPFPCPLDHFDSGADPFKWGGLTHGADDLDARGRSPMCRQVACPSLGGEAGGRSPGFISLISSAERRRARGNRRAGHLPTVQGGGSGAPLAARANSATLAYVPQVKVFEVAPTVA